MQLKSFLSLVGIAIIDSINPTAIAFSLFLLTTKKPFARSFSYISGIFAVYLFLGILLYFGLEVFVKDFFKVVISEDIWQFLQFLIGFVICIIAFRIKPKIPDKTKKPKSINAIHTFLFGISVTFAEFPTALPYLGAIAILDQQNLSPSSGLIFLGIYNFIFIFPHVLLLSLYVLSRSKIEPFLEKIQSKLTFWSAIILKYLLLILGLYLVISAI